VTLASRPKKIASIAALALLAISGRLYAYIMVPSGSPVPPHKVEELLSVAKDGDVICRLGDRLWSHALKDFSVEDRRYSHVGIIKINNGRATVIHAEGTAEQGSGFVKEEALEDFCAIARAIGIYRIKGLDAGLVSHAASKYLGIPFDWQFDSGDESKLYCTELLHVVLKRLKPSLGLKKVYVRALGKEVIPLESISHSDDFSEIYYLAAVRR